MVKPEVIRRRLEKLEEYLAYLDKMKDYSKHTFLNETEVWASAERFLQMAIESVNDIASHIISEGDLGTVNQYRDIPEIDRSQVYNVIQHNPDDVKDLRKVFAQFL